VSSSVSGRWSVLLSGRLLQFNVSILIISFALLVMFIASIRSSDSIICYGGAGVSAFLFVALAVFMMIFYGKQKARPVDGASSTLSFENKSGSRVTIDNPPDTLFEEAEFRLMLRAIAVGADENLCPDGDVVGKASEGKVRKWSEAEKKQFIERHRKELRGRRERAMKLLEEENVASHVSSDQDTAK
jgi:hypothetical protein